MRASIHIQKVNESSVISLYPPINMNQIPLVVLPYFFFLFLFFQIMQLKNALHDAKRNWLSTLFTDTENLVHYLKTVDGKLCY